MAASTAETKSGADTKKTVQLIVAKASAKNLVLQAISGATSSNLLDLIKDQVFGVKNGGDLFLEHLSISPNMILLYPETGADKSENQPLRNAGCAFGIRGDAVIIKNEVKEDQEDEDDDQDEVTVDCTQADISCLPETFNKDQERRAAHLAQILAMGGHVISF